MDLHDVLDGFRVAPRWAQVALVLFALAAVLMLGLPVLTRRRVRRTFGVLARDAGIQAVSEPDEFTQSFSMSVDGRTFEVRHEFRSGGGRHASYRGPVGHLLVTSTRLADDRWELHQVDVGLGRPPRWLGHALVESGDEVFDARFSVEEDGLPVRDRWLDRQTRAAITAFFDTAGVTGPVWVHGQQLMHLARSPWTGIDGRSLRVLLQKQGHLADALEKTAGGPTVRR